MVIATVCQSQRRSGARAKQHANKAAAAFRTRKIGSNTHSRVIFYSKFGIFLFSHFCDHAPVAAACLSSTQTHIQPSFIYLAKWMNVPSSKKCAVQDILLLLSIFYPTFLQYACPHFSFLHFFVVQNLCKTPIFMIAFLSHWALLSLPALIAKHHV